MGAHDRLGIRARLSVSQNRGSLKWLDTFLKWLDTFGCPLNTKEGAHRLRNLGFCLPAEHRAPKSAQICPPMFRQRRQKAMSCCKSLWTRAKSLLDIGGAKAAHTRARHHVSVGSAQHMYPNESQNKNMGVFFEGILFGVGLKGSQTIWRILVNG